MKSWFQFMLDTQMSLYCFFCGDRNHVWCLNCWRCTECSFEYKENDAPPEPEGARFYYDA